MYIRGVLIGIDIGRFVERGAGETIIILCEGEIMNDVELRSLPADKVGVTLLVVASIGNLILEVNTSIEMIVSILEKFILFDIRPIETSKLFDIIIAFDIEDIARALVFVTTNKAS